MHWAKGFEEVKEIKEKENGTTEKYFFFQLPFYLLLIFFRKFNQ